RSSRAPQLLSDSKPSSLKRYSRYPDLLSLARVTAPLGSHAGVPSNQRERVFPGISTGKQSVKALTKLEVSNGARFVVWISQYDGFGLSGGPPGSGQNNERGSV